MNSNQIWCVSYWHVCNNTFLPWPLERSQTVKYLYILITKPISQICIPNFVCLRSIKRYKNTRRDFYLVAMVMPQGWDLGEPGINSVCLLLNHWTKSKRIWCANYSHELGVHKHIFPRLLGPCRGVKRSNIIKSITKSISKILLLNFVFSQIKNYTKYQTRYNIWSPVSCPSGGTWGWEAGGQKFNFSEHGHVAYLIEGVDE